MTLDEVKTLIHTLKYVEDNTDVKFDIDLNIKTIVSISKDEDESKPDESESRNYWINEDNVIVAPCNIRCPYQPDIRYDQTITCTL